MNDVGKSLERVKGSPFYLKNGEISFIKISEEMFLEPGREYRLSDFLFPFEPYQFDLNPNTVRVKKGRIAVGWSNLRRKGIKFWRTKSNRRLWLLPYTDLRSLSCLSFCFPQFCHIRPRHFYYGEPSFDMNNITEDLGALCEDV